MKRIILYLNTGNMPKLKADEYAKEQARRFGRPGDNLLNLSVDEMLIVMPVRDGKTRFRVI